MPARYYSFDPNGRVKELVSSGTDFQIIHCRYGNMSNSGSFFTTTGDIAREEHIVVKTAMGVEMALAISTPRQYSSSKQGYPTEEFDGEIVRVAAKEDIERWNLIRDELEPKEFSFCREMIATHALPMKLVDVEHLLGGDRIVFYFLADGRVDFRALVRDLSKEFKTRIEMRQIGVRDEARLLADYEHCGMPLCCKSFMHDLQPVTMKMAKQQKTTLDPTKISGRCGRLMCCLRFEDDVYSWLRTKLPRKGQIVECANVTGEVVNVSLLREMVLVADSSAENPVWVKMADIKKVRERPGAPPPREREKEDEKEKEPEQDKE
ncbi:MAG: regulatory iron-sulfur-containing complex subunit RicT [Candidatus Brocadiia bacterium]